MNNSKTQSKYTKKDISVYIDNIRKSFAAGKYAPLITAIEFNNYKNVSNNMKLEFAFPVSLIVGANGTNKTSILRALEGCPKGKSLSSYWFSTDLDPIPKAKSEADNPRYVHYYNFPNNRDFHAQVGKRMTFKGHRDDYFEPERRSSDGLEDKDIPKELLIYRKDGGWKPIPKKVLYIDMRQRVAAYDINMTYGLDKIFFEKKNLKLIEELRLKYGYSKTMSKDDRKLYDDELDKRKFTMKRTVKAASKRMSKVFAGEVERNRMYWRKKRFSGGRIIFKPEEIEWINYILGREYQSIVALNHSFFKLPGTTVRVEVRNSKVTANSTYSEAYAGSGEYAVIMMVHNIYKAKEGSLILMDEPENSLHPESQRRLLKYILYKTQMCRHQFVISTHSMYMSENMPDESRIMLYMGSEGAVEAEGKIGHFEAFMGIGGIPEVMVGKTTIQTEDSLASAIVKEAIYRNSPRKLSKYDFKEFGTCGTGQKKLIPAYVKDFRKDVVLVFDGDQNYHNINDISNRLINKYADDGSYNYSACKIALYMGLEGYLAVEEALRTGSFESVEALNKKILLLDGNTKKGTNQKKKKVEYNKLQSARQWLESHVFYLPGEPEPPKIGKSEELDSEQNENNKGNPETWILEIMGEGKFNNSEAKQFFAKSDDVREFVRGSYSGDNSSRDIFKYQEDRLKKFEDSVFDDVYEIISRFEGLDILVDK